MFEFQSSISLAECFKAYQVEKIKFTEKKSKRRDITKSCIYAQRGSNVYLFKCRGYEFE